MKRLKHFWLAVLLCLASCADSEQEEEPEQICTPGDQRCANEHFVETCSESGDSWEKTLCEFGKSCVDSTCICTEDCSESDCQNGGCSDCCPWCGDGICDLDSLGEDCSNCREDCGCGPDLWCRNAEEEGVAGWCSGDCPPKDEGYPPEGPMACGNSLVFECYGDYHIDNGECLFTCTDEDGLKIQWDKPIEVAKGCWSIEE